MLVAKVQKYAKADIPRAIQEAEPFDCILLDEEYRACTYPADAGVYTCIGLERNFYWAINGDESQPIPGFVRRSFGGWRLTSVGDSYFMNDTRVPFLHFHDSYKVTYEGEIIIRRGNQFLLNDEVPIAEMPLGDYVELDILNSRGVRDVRIDWDLHPDGVVVEYPGILHSAYKRLILNFSTTLYEGEMKNWRRFSSGIGISLPDGRVLKNGSQIIHEAPVDNYTLLPGGNVYLIGSNLFWNDELLLNGFSPKCGDVPREHPKGVLINRGKETLLIIIR
ncbi:MAG: hypothetical protein WCV85_00250 [Patescibacteria group bacterium]|jgi:hypothetical protein